VPPVATQFWSQTGSEAVAPKAPEATVTAEAGAAPAPLAADASDTPSATTPEPDESTPRRPPIPVSLSLSDDDGPSAPIEVATATPAGSSFVVTESTAPAPPGAGDGAPESDIDDSVGGPEPSVAPAGAVTDLAVVALEAPAEAAAITGAPSLEPTSDEPVDTPPTAPVSSAATATQLSSPAAVEHEPRVEVSVIESGGDGDVVVIDTLITVDEEEDDADESRPTLESTPREIVIDSGEEVIRIRVRIADDEAGGVRIVEGTRGFEEWITMSEAHPKKKSKKSKKSKKKRK
jgi:hypothetical protein